MGLVNWLKNRLSPVKRDTQRWQELSEAIEEFWVSRFDSEYQKTLDLRSIYTADDAGQIRMIAELGEYYELDVPAENRATVVSMRRLELYQKETDVPVRMMMQRMGISGVEWLPLYGLAEDLYGTKFYTEKQLAAIGVDTPGESSFEVSRLDGTWHLGSSSSPVKLKKAGTYLTSRARLGVNLLDFKDTSIIPKLVEKIRKVKPLHIVFDGMQYWIYFDAAVKVSTNYALYMMKSFNQTYPGNNRVDGSWKIGTNIINPHYHLTGQWKLNGKNKLGAYLTTGVVHRTLAERKISASGVITKTVTRPDAYLNARLGESLLKLDGLWHVGSNKILTLSGQRHMNKVIQIGQPTVTSTSSVSSSELQYPGNPLRLAKVIPLNSFRRLNGSWKVGETTSKVQHVSPAGGWKLRRNGIDTVGAGDIIRKSSAISLRTIRLAGPDIVPGEKYRKLDGSWHVGAYSALNGRWKLQAGRRLRAPRLGETGWELSGPWQLLPSVRKLDRSWKVGASTGPCCESTITICKIL